MSPIVTLRRTSADDAEQVAGWRAEPTAMAFQPLKQYPVPHLRSILDVRGSRTIEPKADGKFQWIVNTPDGDAGWISITILNRDYGIAALGYTITTRLQRRGYATAAVRAILPTVFTSDALDLFRLEAIAAVENCGSRRVLAACGFHLDGIVSRLLEINGVMVDHARYSLNRLRWIDQVAHGNFRSNQNQEEISRR